jgi:hypothetical protein
MVNAVLWIRICFNADPDLAFLVNAERIHGFDITNIKIFTAAKKFNS